MTPSDIGSVGMAATGSGGVLSAFGALSSGVANKQMYDYRAALSKMNAQILRQDSDFAMQTGDQENMKFGLKAGQQMGQIKVTQAASGLDVNSGSNAQVRASQEQLNTLDMSTIRSNAAKTAYNYNIQATMSDAQATLDQRAGSNSLMAGVVGAGSSILGSAASVSSEWLQGQRVGLWGATGDTGGNDYYSGMFGG